MSDPVSVENDLLARRLEGVRAAIRETERSSGRKEGDVTILAAVKYATAGQIAALARLGLADFGENRADKLEADLPYVRDLQGARMHFIGSLQTRKARFVVPNVSLIHSLDSVRLADEIEKVAAAAGIVSRVLVEINSSREESKGGVLPEDAPDLAKYVLSLPHLSLRGFMTMGGAGLTQDEYYDLFSGVERLASGIWRTNRLPGKPYLSMGMTDSFRPAVAAGSDCVRIGRALFEDATGGTPGA